MTPTIEDVRLAAAAHFGVTRRDLDVDRRSIDIVRRRHIAMAAAKRVTAKSLPEIGRRFGRDHTAVLHAVRKIERLALEDDETAADLAAIERLAYDPPPERPLALVVEGRAVAPELRRLIAAVRQLERDRFSAFESLAITEVIKAGRACRGLENADTPNMEL